METKQIIWTEKQQEIINALSKSNRLLVEGGVRVGKDWAILYMIDIICRLTPGMTAIILRKNFESIKKDTHNILRKSPGFLSEATGKGKWCDGGHRFEYRNGSVLHFSHAEEAEHLLGFTAGLIYINQVELIKEEDYNLILTRLSQYGNPEKNLATREYITKYGKEIEAGKCLRPQNYLFLTANPKACWVKERFIDKKPEGLAVIHCSTYDNIINLSEEEIAFASSASESFKQRYYEGSWQFASGVIYPEFDDENIVEPSFDIKNQIEFGRLKTYVGIDPGYSISKFAVLFATILPDGRIYIFDEVVKNGRRAEEWQKVGIPEIVAEMKTKYGLYHFIPSIGLIDSASNAHTAQGSESITEQFQKLGISLKNCRKTNENDTIFGIKNLLKRKQIIVSSRCANLIREFGLFRWHEKVIDKPVDADNDCLDVLRYIVNDFPTPQQKTLTIKEAHQQVWGQGAYEKWWKECWENNDRKKANPLAYTNTTKFDWGI